MLPSLVQTHMVQLLKLMSRYRFRIESERTRFIVSELASGVWAGLLGSVELPQPRGVCSEANLGVVGPTDLGPPTDGGLVDLFDLGLVSDMAGDMGDSPGWSLDTEDGVMEDMETEATEDV